MHRAAFYLGRERCQARLPPGYYKSLMAEKGAKAAVAVEDHRL